MPTKDNRLAFLCSGNGYIFGRVCSEMPVTLCVVDRQCRSIEVAERHGVPWRCIARDSFGSREEFSDAILTTLLANKIDLVCTTFDSLLSGKILREYKGKLINVHPALVQEFPGTKSIERTLGSGVAWGGVTVHLIDETIDGGKILAQEAISTSVGAEMYGRLVGIKGASLLISAIKTALHNV